MKNQPERPAMIKRAPRAAADESRDPVDTTPPTQTPAPEVSDRPRRRREVTVQFATRVSPEILDLILDLADLSGRTQRSVVEAAIQEYAKGKLSR